MVITVVEAGAVGDAVRVTVAMHVGLQGLFEKAEAVTPVGSGVVMLNVTGAVVAPVANVAVAVSTPPGAPSVMGSVEGEAARLKSKDETTRVKVVVCVRTGEPPVAWMVITVEEAGAPVAAVKVTVAEHVGLQGLFESVEAVTPVGSVVRMLNVTGEVVALALSVAVAVSTPPDPPALIVKLDGLAASVKSKKPETTSVNVAV